MNRKFVNIIAGIYLSMLTITLLIFVYTHSAKLFHAGNFMLYGGVFIIVSGFTFLGSDRRLDRHEDKEQFAARRKRERPVALIAWAVIFSGILALVSGYFVLSFL